MFFTSIFCGSLFCGSAVHFLDDLIADSGMLSANRGERPAAWAKVGPHGR
jgi:hypothetical protein